MSESKQIDQLTADQQQTLQCVLDMIIPEDRRRGKPSAAEIDVFSFIQLHEPGYVDTLKQELDEVIAESLKVHGGTFQSLANTQQLQLVDTLRRASSGLFRQLAVWTATAYYQDDRVMEAIGLPARPPFPLGYEVESGDIGLLDPVKARGRIYRDA